MEAFVLQGLAAGLTFVMHSFLANMLGVGQYGLFSYALTIAGFLAVITTLGLPNSVLRYVPEYLETERWAELKGVLIRTGQLTLVIPLMFSVGLGVIAWVFLQDSYLSKSLFLASCMTFPMAYGLWRTRATRGLHKLKEALLPEEVLRPLFVTLSIWVIGTNNYAISAVTATFAYVIVSIAISFAATGLMLAYVPNYVRQSNAIYHNVQWLKTSFSMLIGRVLQQAMARMDVFLLGLLAGMQATGLYSAAVRIALINVFIKMVVDLVIAPKISASYHNGDIALTRRILREGQFISTVSALPLLALMFLSPGWLLHWFGPGFDEASPYLQILSIGQFINALVGPVGNGLLMTGHEKIFTRIVFVTSLISTLVIYLAIQQWGALGAAIATTLGSAIFNISLYMAVRKTIYHHALGQ